MLIEELVNFCDRQFSLGNTHNCLNCQHECSGSCKQCLEEIHYPGRYRHGKKNYDCYNLLNFYVCDYSYKYASEIWYLLKESEAIKKIEKYHIMSIGCGGCPDLMAFESFIIDEGLPKTIFYKGIDVNELWKPIHKEIETYKNDIVRKIRFKYVDAIEYFNDNSVPSTNVLVLQYVISHFYNTNQIDKIDTFYDNLIKNIVLRKDQKVPFVIIINDVNSNNRGRDFFMDLCKKLKKSNLHFKYSRYYFDYNIQSDFQKYGIKHTKKSVMYHIPGKLSKYEPWEVCSSAQLLIELK